MFGGSRKFYIGHLIEICIGYKWPEIKQRAYNQLFSAETTCNNRSCRYLLFTLSNHSQLLIGKYLAETKATLDLERFNSGFVGVFVKTNLSAEEFERVLIKVPIYLYNSIALF